MRRKKKSEPDFDIALSFAGEDRDYVEEVAAILKRMGFRVFYDKYEAVTLWGKDLYTHLREIYFERARYTVIFISKHYKKKLWSNHELKSAQARAFEESREYILPVRFDRTQIPGILPTTGYVNLSSVTPLELADSIKKKIGPMRRKEFFPEDTDRLYKYMKVGKGSKKQRELIHTLASEFFKGLKLMTPMERKVLAVAVQNTCAAGPPDNVHLKIELLSRLTSLSPEELKSLFSRLDCLYINTRTYWDDSHEDPDNLAKSSEIIHITYKPLLADYDGDNATFLMLGVLDCIYENLCPKCSEKALEQVDFSILSTLAGFAETHQ